MGTEIECYDCGKEIPEGVIHYQVTKGEHSEGEGYIDVPDEDIFYCKSCGDEKGLFS